MSDPLIKQVRENVRRIVASQGVDTEGMSESFLIRDGYYCGRRFRIENIQAVWFVEENELKVYNADGSLMLVTEATASQVEQDTPAVEQETPAIRRAA